MGLKDTFRNIRNVWNLASMTGDIPIYDTLKHIDFFSYVGDNCTPGFTIQLSCFDGLEEAFKKCSPLSTIINRNAMAMANAKWWLTDNETDSEVKGYDNIKRLLKNPNPLQSWTEFMIQLDTYRQLYGEVFVYAPTGLGFSIQDAMALLVINPRYIEIKQTNKLYFQNDIDEIIEAYYLNIDGTRKELNKSNVLHIKDTYQNLCFNSMNIRGASRISGLEYPIRNIIQAQEAVYSLNKDRGAQGILANSSSDSLGAMPLNEEEKKNIQKQFLGRYGLRDGQGKVIITDASLRWQQMSFNVKDLMLFEGIKSNIEQMADAFSYPFELLANQNGTTYNNKNEAKKILYQDNTIPVSKIYNECFTSFFGLNNTNISLYADFSEVECLQEGEKEKATALNMKITALSKAYHDGIITLEEYRKGIDYDEKATGNIYYTGSN